MRFDFSFGTGPRTPRRLPADVRRVLLLADLRGNAAGDDASLADRPIRKVDIDSLEDVLAKAAPAIQLGDAAGGERIDIRQFDDFHPDSLVQRLTTCQRLRDLRARLEDPRTFAQAADELQRDAAAPRADQSAPHALPSPGSDVETFDRLLGRTGPATPGDAAARVPPPSAPSALDALIRQAIAPHIVPAPSPQLPLLRAAVDAAMADLLRAVLHDPAFQALEATWRGVQWLVATLELGESLELYVLHLTRDELETGATHDAHLWRRLVEGEWRPGGSRELSLVVGGYRFGPWPEDLAALQSGGDLAAALGVPFLAEAHPALLGVSSLSAQPDPRTWTADQTDDATRWSAFRATPAASHVALALPRFLLRLPYGQRTDPITAFAFDEQPPTPSHDAFLWGNPALAYAVGIARALDPDGNPDDAVSLDGLPGFAYGGDDGPALQPPTEVVLTERAVEAVQARGLLPLIGYQDRLDVRLLAPRAAASDSRP